MSQNDEEDLLLGQGWQAHNQDRDDRDDFGSL